jgi:tRNA A37 threonylcarbamoyltransferase TsaD
MKTTVNIYDFQRAFKAYDRDNFSYEGLKALFEHLEQYEDDTGEEVELDVIALCCEFTEYACLEDFQEDYGEEFKTLEEIGEHTTVIPVEHSALIIAQF